MIKSIATDKLIVLKKAVKKVGQSDEKVGQANLDQKSGLSL